MMIKEFAEAAATSQTMKEINDSNYPRFGDMMESMGYDWEPMKVTTEDDYILTTFHILGKSDGSTAAPSQGSVLIQHGDLEDGTSWMTNYTNLDQVPFHLLLVDAGYDVYVGSNRGTEYSWDHMTLDSSTDPEYWNWTWAEMGLYDDTANISAIKQKTGEDKIFYIGYSQGTMQMHYGLAHIEDTFYAQNLHKTVSLAPCFIPHVPNWTKDYANATVMQF